MRKPDLFLWGSKNPAWVGLAPLPLWQEDNLSVSSYCVANLAVDEQCLEALAQSKGFGQEHLPQLGYFW